MKILLNIFLLFLSLSALGQSTYTNPIIHADYSDPDVVRKGEDYYLTASSFNHIPGLPILHSKDLVQWKIISYALTKQPPFDHYSKVQHGNGVWAPAIRYHDQQFYIYYPDPDFGIYMTKAKDPKGPWTEPVLVQEGKGLIDPCPLWDEDGKVYLVHAFAGSRAGIKSILVVKEMNKEGTKVISDGVLVYDGHIQDPTVEGPKFYKRNGYYYIFAPAGGVSTGWQIALRSRNIYGPYERKVVMAQGSSAVNGPHQGAWVNTVSGEDWFLHFQDKGAYGRIVHLQPMKWENDWPVIGIDKEGKGTGEPVSSYKLPGTNTRSVDYTLSGSDEFSGNHLGPQWQWQANPGPNWYFTNPSKGELRLNCVLSNDSNLYNTPSLLTQTFPAEEFTSTVKMKLTARNENDRAGLIIFGLDYATLSIKKTSQGSSLIFSTCQQADKGNKETLVWEKPLSAEGELWLRVSVKKGAVCSFSYSINGQDFIQTGQNFEAKQGKWVGARTGVFAIGNTRSNDSGYADLDWFHIRYQ